MKGTKSKRGISLLLALILLIQGTMSPFAAETEETQVCTEEHIETESGEVHVHTADCEYTEVDTMSADEEDDDSYTGEVIPECKESRDGSHHWSDGQCTECHKVCIHQ